MPQTTPAANDDSGTPISFPAVGRKKLTAAFDGGRLTSDGGVLLLAQAERSMGICAQLAACIADRRDPARVIHTLPDILRARIFAICCGYEDADDLDMLRDDIDEQDRNAGPRPIGPERAADGAGAPDQDGLAHACPASSTWSCVATWTSPSGVTHPRYMPSVL